MCSDQVGEDIGKSATKTQPQPLNLTGVPEILLGRFTTGASEALRPDVLRDPEAVRFHCQLGYD